MMEPSYVFIDFTIPQNGGEGKRGMKEREFHAGKGGDARKAGAEIRPSKNLWENLCKK
jgi:hypothetical protein